MTGSKIFDCGLELRRSLIRFNDRRVLTGVDPGQFIQIDNPLTKKGFTDTASWVEEAHESQTRRFMTKQRRTSFGETVSVYIHAGR